MVTPDGQSPRSALQAENTTQSKLVSFDQNVSSQDRSSSERTHPRGSTDKYKEQDESSPLLAPNSEGIESPPSFDNVHSPLSSDDWDGAAEESKSSGYLFLLTLAIGG